MENYKLKNPRLHIKSNGVVYKGENMTDADAEAILKNSETNIVLFSEYPKDWNAPAGLKGEELRESLKAKKFAEIKEEYESKIPYESGTKVQYIEKIVEESK